MQQTLSIRVYGNHMFQVSSKHQEVKTSLQSWNLETFGPVASHIFMAQDVLQQVQLWISSEVFSDPLFYLELEAQFALNLELKREEMLLKD